jgi:hypothetical protein
LISVDVPACRSCCGGIGASPGIGFPIKFVSVFASL